MPFECFPNLIIFDSWAYSISDRKQEQHSHMLGQLLLSRCLSVQGKMSMPSIRLYSLPAYISDKVSGSIQCFSSLYHNKPMLKRVLSEKVL